MDTLNAAYCFYDSNYCFLDFVETITRADLKTLVYSSRSDRCYLYSVT